MSRAEGKTNGNYVPNQNVSEAISGKKVVNMAQDCLIWN